MAELVKRYDYPPQQDFIELYSDGFVLVKFGEVTQTDLENNAETAWVQDCLEDMKRLHTSGPLVILFDFRTIDSGEFNTKESNQKYRAMLHDPAIRKVAVYGLPVGWQLVIDLLRAFVPHKLKVFASEVDAKAWLYAAD